MKVLVYKFFSKQKIFRSHFRANLDKDIANIEDLEEKLEKILKCATNSVDIGKKYVENQR